MIPAWVGVWTLSAVMSGTPGSPGTLQYTRGTKQILSTPASITIIDELVRIRGGVVHLEWTGTLDGRDYPVEGVEIYLTSAYRQIDDHTLELTQKLDGRVVVHARLVLSADGKTITTTTTDGLTTAITTYLKRSN